ncbi:unnamed protein product, partial [Ectocarpus sp. 8 AP-2014]
VTARVNSRPPLKLQSFDGLVDHSCMEDQEKKGGLFSKMKHVISTSYSPPVDASGAVALLALDQWLEDGLKLEEGKYGLGFPFMYLLLTGSMGLKVLPEDNTFNWGAVLLRLLPWEQTQRKDLVMSVLRALAYNPSLAVDAPKWQPKVSA